MIMWVLTKKYSAETLRYLNDYADKTAKSSKRRGPGQMFQDQFRFCSFFRRIACNSRSVAIYKRDDDDVWALRVEYHNAHRYSEFAPAIFGTEKDLDNFLANYENMSDTSAVLALIADFPEQEENPDFR
jgi:hypothetical protein